MASQTNSAHNKPQKIFEVIEPRRTIFVFGSLDIRANDAERAQFEASCRSLGKLLAQRQFLISVASAATFTVDLHVLAGADAWCEGKAALPVQFIGPAQLPADEPPLENDANQFPNLDCKKRLLRGDWEPSHERQLQEADGIILVGGNPHGVSIRVGSAVIQRGIPFIPVPIFDGAGAELWESHSQTLKVQGIPSGDINTMSEEFSAELIVSSLISLMDSQRPWVTNAESQQAEEPLKESEEPPNNPEESKMSPEERLKFVRRLSALPAPQFSQLLFSIDPPGGIVPAGGAQGAQVAALLNWAEGPGGCGLTTIEGLLDTLTNGE